MQPKHMAFIAAAASVALWTMYQGIAPSSPQQSSSAQEIAPSPLVTLPQRTSTSLDVMTQGLSIGAVDIVYQINVSGLTVDNAQKMTSEQFKTSLQKMIKSSVDSSLAQRTPAEILQQPHGLADSVAKELQQRLNRDLGPDVLLIEQLTFSNVCQANVAQCIDVAMSPLDNLKSRRADYPSSLPRPEHFLDDLSKASRRIAP